MPHNNHQNDGSILLMPNNVVCAFKVTFTEAELLLTAKLSEHHLKCYKLLKYVINPEIQPLQTYTSKIKYLFQDKSLVPSYALKIIVWNHRFNQKCFEENDTFSCVFQMLSFHCKCSLRDDKLTHPFNRKSGFKVTSDESGKIIASKLWNQIGIRMKRVLIGLRNVQRMPIYTYDYETCCREVAIRGCRKFSSIKNVFLLNLLLLLFLPLLVYLGSSLSSGETSLIVVFCCLLGFLVFISACFICSGQVMPKQKAPRT